MAIDNGGADFLLTVGVDTGLSLKSMREGITNLVERLNGNPPKIKVDFYINSNTLTTLKAQIDDVCKKLDTTAAVTVTSGGSTQGVAKDTAAINTNTQARRTNINSIREQAAAQKSIVVNTTEYTQLLKKTQTLLGQIVVNRQKWTAAEMGSSAKSYENLATQAQQLRELITYLNSGKATSAEFNRRFSAIAASVNQSNAEIKSAGENTKTWTQRVSGLSEKFSTWFGISRVLMAAYRAIRQMISNVIELDTAMTELKKVTNETEETYNRFLGNATTRAKQLGAALTDVVKASADFARLGFNIEEAEKLADAAIVYKNVGDGIDDISTASESIIATMQAFGVEAKDAMLIVDKFNEVGNNYAIASKGVGDALLRSAAAMNAANNTLDETIALSAAANTVVQDPEKVGTALKTVSMYLRAAKTDAEDAGEATDGMAGSVSELRKDILNLTGNKVDIQIDENTFKSTYQILKELSAVWGDLSDVSQANILEMVGGKRNSNIVAAILENFTIAEEALATSSNSAGSALSENEKVLESIQGKLNQLKASFEAFSNSVFDSGFIKGVVDGARTILEIITAISDTLGSFPTLISAITGVMSARNLSKGKVAGIISPTASGGVSLFGVDWAAQRQEKEEWISYSQKTEQATAAISRYNSVQSKSVEFQNKYNNALKNSQTPIGKYLRSLNGGKASLEGYNRYCEASIKGVRALGIGSKIAAVGVNLLSTALNMLISFGIALAIQAIITAINNWIHADEKLRESVEETTTAYNDQISTINSNRKTIKGMEEDFDEFSKGINANGENISLTRAQYESYLDMANQIADIAPDLVKGYDDQGNAILKYGTTIEKVNDLLDEQIKKSEEALLVGEGNVGGYEGFTDALKNAQTKITKAGKDFLNNRFSFTDDISAGTHVSTGGYGLEISLNIGENKVIDPTGGFTALEQLHYLYTDMVQLLKDAGAEWENLNFGTFKDFRTGEIYATYELSREQVSKIKSYVQEQKEIYKKALEDASRDLVPYIKAYVHDIDVYSSLDGMKRTLIDNYIPQFDVVDGNGIIKSLDTIKKETEDFVNMINGLSDDEVNYVVQMQSLLNSKEHDLGDLRDKWKQIEDAFGEDSDITKVISVMFNIDTTTFTHLDDLIKKFDEDSVDYFESLSPEQLEEAWSKRDIFKNLDELKGYLEQIQLQSNLTAKSFSDIYNEGVKNDIDAITKAEKEMTESNYLSLESVKDLQENGLSDYLTQTENGWILANGALDTYINSLKSNYTDAVDKAIEGCKTLVGYNETERLQYANTTKGLLAYVEALKLARLAKIDDEFIGAKTATDISTAIAKGDYAKAAEIRDNFINLNNNPDYMAQVESVNTMFDPYIENLQTIVDDQGKTTDLYDSIANSVERDSDNVDKGSKAQSQYNKKVKKWQDQYINGKLSYADFKKKVKDLNDKEFKGSDNEAWKANKEGYSDLFWGGIEGKQRKKIDDAKHKLEMGEITQSDYLEVVKKVYNYITGAQKRLDKLPDLKADVELELHTAEAEKAVDDFEKNTDSIIESFLNQKDPKGKKRKNNKKGYTFSEFKSDYNAYIKEVEKIDKNKAKELVANRDKVFETAKEDFIDRYINDLKSDLDMGEITNEEYIKALETIGTTLKKLGIDIEDFPDIKADIELEIHEDNVDKAIASFEKKLNSSTSKYVQGSISYDEFISDYDSFIKEVEKTDKAEANKLRKEKAKNVEEARKEKMNRKFSDNERNREYGFIDDEKYIEEYFSMTEYYYKEGLLSAEEYKDNMQEVYNKLKDMYAEDAEEKIESLEKQLDSMRDFIDKQKELLQDQSDAEDYEEQSQKYRDDIAAAKLRLAELERDTSLQGRKIAAQVRQDIEDMEKEQSDFEDEHALNTTLDTFDDIFSDYEKGITSQITTIQTTLDSVNENGAKTVSILSAWAQEQGIDVTLINQAYESLWNGEQYASGTSASKGGWALTQESGAEAVAVNRSGRFTLLTPDSMVWNAEATKSLYQFANSPMQFISSLFKNIIPKTSKPITPISLTVGDVNVYGNGKDITSKDVAYEVLKQFKKLQ